MREITPINNNGLLRLRFSVKGQRYSFNPVPGGRYDDPDDFKAAQAVALTIMGDVRTGNFDPTLAKYGGNLKVIQSGLDASQERLKELRAKQSQQDIRELWDKYREFKRPQLAPTTLMIDFGRRMNFLGSLPTTKLAEAVAIRDWIVANKPPHQAKKILTQLSACCDWAVESGMIELNPFAGAVRRIKTVTDDDAEINPFTTQERDRIISAFEANRYYRHYAPLVAFLFFTGCRPSEALGLEWRDVRGGKLTFRRSYAEGTMKAGLKNQKQRTITLSEKAQAVLEGLPRQSEIIFLAPEGGRIDWHNFANRAWRAVLESLPEIEYRNPKQTRHSFITEQILAGQNPSDVAKYCGNRSVTIYRRYLGGNREFRPS
ncbi:site-specific integrase [Synechocystis sp. LKSZ1]|uniref:tyrosine-type recombinase/integrase n=1 Tax=Synechocystis sp. LKSZ1 TaxID=3144951 RepID=UPI00336BB973